jgi:hypothetical protein
MCRSTEGITDFVIGIVFPDLDCLPATLVQELIPSFSTDSASKQALFSAAHPQSEESDALVHQVG